MESPTHRGLVDLAILLTKRVVPSGLHCLIEADREGFIRPTKVTGGAVPDVSFSGGDFYIISEAKTVNDFNRRHSHEQFLSYMDALSDFSGEIILIITVPMIIYPDAINHFRNLKRKTKSRAKVLISCDVDLTTVV